eukprot:gnl/Trimastix_PCT/2297.p1 GENE.gnl/Trimastix_PCT/2297~~gnl/Trimastix_PCT/2297.p1  ORF type:complete len:346 (-),score=82.89 gnl/Trimastix_PCT/2297:80-1117(-)
MLDSIPHSRKRLYIFGLILLGMIVAILVFSQMARPPISSANLVPKRFPIGIISDMDKKSKVKDWQWQSKFRTGFLVRDSSGQYTIEWDENETVLTSGIGEKGRSMELSELILYQDRLYACDDRVGLVFEIKGGKAIPRHILRDGDGDGGKGFKCEWATVKGKTLYFGSVGKEYVLPDGTIESYGPMWVKEVSPDGVLRHVDWTARYEALRKAAGCPYPGYLVHEAVAWSPRHNRWFFLPRRASKEAYDETLDETRGTNILLSADPAFRDISVTPVGEHNPNLGFSSLKFLPDAPNHFVALKTKEVGDDVQSFIGVYTTSGEVLMQDSFVGDVKFEGVEFLATKSG